MKLELFLNVLTPVFAKVFGEEKARNVLTFFHDFRCLDNNPHFKSWGDLDAGHYAQILYFMIVADSPDYYQSDNCEIPPAANWIIPDLADAFQYIGEKPSKRNILKIALGKNYLRVQWLESHVTKLKSGWGPNDNIVHVPCQFEMGVAMEPVIVLDRNVLEKLLIQ